MKIRTFETALRLFFPALLFPWMGCLASFGAPSVDGDQVVFHGATTSRPLFFRGYEAIYMSSGGCLATLATNLSTGIPGGTGKFIGFGSMYQSSPDNPRILTPGDPSFDAGDVAFWGAGTLGQEGIYLLAGGSFHLIADRNTAIPGGIGEFYRFDLAPSLKRGSVAFASNHGIYLHDGNTLRVVMDRSTRIPGSPYVNFWDHGTFSVGEGNVVAFDGTGRSTAPAGIYLDTGSSLSVVADGNTLVPGGTGNFTGLGDLSMDSGDIVFGGSWGGSSRQGLYLYSGGALTVIADGNTFVPGTAETFVDFGSFEIDQGDVAFVGVASQYELRGIYLDAGGSLSTVVDTNTLVPGGTSTFSDLTDLSMDSGDIVFRGRRGFSLWGIYAFSGGSLALIADESTAVPGGTGNFAAFGDVEAGGGDVAFVGVGGGQTGIYLRSGVSFSVIVDDNTPVPGGTGNFTEFTELSMDSGNVVFRGAGVDRKGIYLYSGGSLTVVADSETPVPAGTGNFDDFTDVSADGGDISFVTPNGVYVHDGSTLRRVADENVMIPGGTGDFATLTTVSADGENVAFRGLGEVLEAPAGVYWYDGNEIHVVADKSTAIPGGAGNFVSFGNGVSADGSDVAFVGVGEQQAGIYLAAGGSLSTVVDTNTAIPGGMGTFTKLRMGPESLSDGDVAFLGSDDQGAWGIYLEGGGALRVLADTHTPIPGGTGNFTTFTKAPSLDRGNATFSGAASSGGVPNAGQYGVYLHDGSALSVIADTNTRVLRPCTSASP